mgnify:CR=1 FL=1
MGLFGAGCQPSSSNDPFGLRRISYGLVRGAETVNIITYIIFFIQVQVLVDNIFYTGSNIG